MANETTGGGPPIDITGARALNALMWEQAQRAQPMRLTLGSKLVAVGTGTIVAQTMGRATHTVEVAGTFTATINIMGSTDGENFDPLTPYAVISGTASAADITAPGMYLFRGAFVYLRADVTAYTNGTVQTVQVVSTMV